MAHFLYTLSIPCGQHSYVTPNPKMHLQLMNYERRGPRAHPTLSEWCTSSGSAEPGDVRSGGDPPSLIQVHWLIAGILKDEVRSSANISGETR